MNITFEKVENEVYKKTVLESESVMTELMGNSIEETETEIITSKFDFETCQYVEISRAVKVIGN